MAKRSWQRKVMLHAPLVLAGVAGCALAWWRFGWEILEPTSITWFRGDSAWHFLSWMFFRTEQWHPLPGRIEGFLAPLGTSIGASDALPLLAFPFKLFGTVLPNAFQYFGLWLFISYALQGVFGYLLVDIFCRRRWLSLVGALLLLLSPVFIFRAGHIALASHWLLLFALWHYLRTALQLDFNPKAYTATWLLIVGLTGLTHPYLTAMIVPLLILSLVSEVRFKQRVSESYALILTAGAFALLGLEWWLSGLIGVGKGGGFDLYTLNPNALFNPLGYSRILPALPLGPGQYEGFAYLGLGLLALGGVTALSLILDSRLRNRARTHLLSPRHRPLLLIGLGLSLFSLGNTYIFILEVLALYALLLRFFLRHPPRFLERLQTLPLRRWHLGLFLVLLGLIMVAGIPLVTSTFRAPGRFIWPVVYGLELFAIVFVCRHFRSALAGTLLVVALGLQLVDLQINRPFEVGQTTFREHLKSAAWPIAVAPYKTLAIIPPFEPSTAAPNDYLDFGFLAATTGKRVTTGTLVRIPNDLERVTQSLMDEALAGPRDPETLYIFGTDSYNRSFEGKLKPGLRCTVLDAYTLCRLPENP